jgi:hypothetical protein
MPIEVLKFELWFFRNLGTKDQCLSQLCHTANQDTHTVSIFTLENKFLFTLLTTPKWQLKWYCLTEVSKLNHSLDHKHIASLTVKHISKQL